MNFEISIDIAAPPEVVWAVMTDAERWPQWTRSVTSIRRLDSGNLRIGSRALIRQPKFPPAVWKVTALEPGRSFTWKSGAPLMWVFAHHSIDPAQVGSRVTLRLYYEGFVGRLLGRLTRDITNRYLVMEANGLKKKSEQSAIGHQPSAKNNLC